MTTTTTTKAAKATKATKATTTKAPAKATKATTTKAPAKATKATTKAKATTAQATKAGDLAAFIVAEVGKRIGSKYYTRALSYHKEAGTVFPRERTAAARASLTVEDVEETMRQHDAFILAAGNAKGQAIFDVYMTNAK